MSRARLVGSTVLLVVEAFLAFAGGAVAYGLTAEYGEIGDSRTAALGGVGEILAIALALVGGVGCAAVLAGRTRLVTVLAVAIPAVMLLGTWLSMPWALQDKLDAQYDAVPQCLDREMTTGPGAEGARAAQETFDSIDHVGWFGGGGGSGVGGCDRPLLLTERTDVVGHYRTVLEADGWRVVEDEPSLLRAEKDGRAFQVSGGGSDWTVWTGPTGGVAP